VNGKNGVRAYSAAIGRLEIDAMDASRIAEIRIRPEHQLVDDVEHRCVRANTETERDYDRGREAWIATETAQCVARILLKMVEPRDRPGIARRFVNRG
jgi:hypothetical protein